MIPSESLHQLISSLSKSEKRSFKLFISKYQSKHSNNYTKLFSVIAEQANYSEELVKKQFEPSSTIIRHLPSEKNYLFNLILASLRNVQKQSQLESKLQIELHNIDVLISKDLIDSAGKQIKRSKKKIFQFEKWTMLIQLINLEKQWIQKVGINQMTDAHFNRLEKELHLALNRISHEHAYWYLFIKLFKLHSHKVKLRKILAPEIKTPETKCTTTFPSASQNHRRQTQLLSHSCFN